MCPVSTREETEEAEAPAGALPSNTFSDKVERDAWPPFLLPVIYSQTDPTGRDKMLLGTLTLVSGLLTRGLYGIYDRRHVYTPFYTILYGGFAPDEQTVVCDERDFQTVITLIDCLVNHTARIYAIIGKTDSDPFGSAPGMPADLARLCEALPRGRDFIMSEAIRTGAQQGLSERTIRRMVGRLVSKYQVVERVKHGTYRRVERKEGQA